MSLFICAQVHSHFIKPLSGCLFCLMNLSHLSSSVLWEGINRAGANLVLLALKEMPAITWRKTEELR